MSPRRGFESIIIPWFQGRGPLARQVGGIVPWPFALTNGLFEAGGVRFFRFLRLGTKKLPGLSTGELR